jgi:coproporphyrinogen III oxidase-like Fe-S oxidoreductase
MMPAPSSFSLYIHWPFCLAKCPYCDFNSHVGDIIDPDHWQKALIQELENSAYHLAENLDRPLNQLELSSIFFGGGTPTLMPPIYSVSQRISKSQLKQTQPQPKPLN